MSRKIETLANVAIIVAALVFSATVVREKWLAQRVPTPTAQTDSRLRGTDLHISGVKWDNADKTLVMALSTQCHFCQESVPFYKELTAAPAVKSKRVMVLTIFPQPQDEAESFVKASEIRADRVLSMPVTGICANGPGQQRTVAMGS